MLITPSSTTLRVVLDQLARICVSTFSIQRRKRRQMDLNGLQFRAVPMLMCVAPADLNFLTSAILQIPPPPMIGKSAEIPAIESLVRSSLMVSIALSLIRGPETPPSSTRV